MKFNFNLAKVVTFAIYGLVALPVCMGLMGSGIAQEASVTVPVAPEAAPAPFYYGALIWNAVFPYILAAVTAVVGTVITFAGIKIEQVFKIKVDQSYRDQLHNAAMTGVNAALAKVGGQVSKLKANDLNPIVKEAATWVMTSGASIAADKLGATPAAVEEIVRAKLNMILTAQTTSATVQDLQKAGVASVVTR
jgi:hypothetical protein